MQGLRAVTKKELYSYLVSPTAYAVGAVFLLIRAINQLKRKEEAAPKTKECPQCCSTISVKAKRCPNCTSEL